MLILAALIYDLLEYSAMTTGTIGTLPSNALPMRPINTHESTNAVGVLNSESSTNTSRTIKIVTLASSLTLVLGAIGTGIAAKVTGDNGDADSSMALGVSAGVLGFVGLGAGVLGSIVAKKIRQ
nr:SepZ [Edwardsiella sp. EA181011]